jgi:vancomycin resistance protein VanW
MDPLIKEKIFQYRNPKRVALSKRYPFLSKPILFIKHFLLFIHIKFSNKYSYSKKTEYMSAVIARHQSPLFRPLQDVENSMHINKIINIRLAIKELDGVIIIPGKTFSLWNIVGNPTYKKGYVDGMLLSDGKMIEGVGGGLCQLSNLLYWVFLHSEMKITERFHHSRDVFPDSGRTLPFGSGATIMYNTIDLKVKNVTDYPIQIKVWLTEKQVKVQLRSKKSIAKKFHVYEKNHMFIKDSDDVFRANTIYRDVLVKGEVIATEKMTENFAPVMYEL